MSHCSRCLFVALCRFSHHCRKSKSKRYKDEDFMRLFLMWLMTGRQLFEMKFCGKLNLILVVFYVKSGFLR
jgi:hypothetical protein